MQIGFKYNKCYGFGKLYEYSFKQTHMITNEANERLKILLFWNKYGLEAAMDAYGAKRSTLYNWKKIYEESGKKIESLNPKSQAPLSRRKRITDYRIINEIKRLRIEVCPNMGKEKVKEDLDKFCKENNLKTISASTIGRIIKEKRIYHHRQKIYHNGRVRQETKIKKLRKPKEFKAKNQGDLVEVDTIVKYVWGVKRYIITAVDVKTRYSFAWEYKRHDSQSTRDFFQKLEAITPFKIKAVQTDNGSEFHRSFRDYLKTRNIIHYWNHKGQPYKNGHIEKYNRTIQEEFIDQNEILLEEPEEFNEKLIDWLLWYNTKRYHWGLNLTSPVDYMLKNNMLSKMYWTNTFT